MEAAVGLDQILNLTNRFGVEGTDDFPPIPTTWTTNQVLELWRQCTSLAQQNDTYADMDARDQVAFLNAADLFFQAHRLLDGRYGQLDTTTTRCFQAIASTITILRTRPRNTPEAFADAAVLLAAIQWDITIDVAREGTAARARIQRHIHDLVPASYSEAELARSIGVDRMTVRNWLGKR